jgi:NAD(P)H-dependent FMN reductase
MKIVCVSGSLRAQSSNAAILRAAAKVAPPGVELVLHEGIGALPYFNPDLDAEGAIAPPPVAAFRAQLAAADAVILCTPEYAHGVPGALKNALDWLVSTVELIGKPVAVVSVSPSGGEHAQSQLMHTLATMSWTVVEPACLRIALGRAQLDANGELADATVIEQLRVALAALATSTDQRGDQ